MQGSVKGLVLTGLLLLGGCLGLKVVSVLPPDLQQTLEKGVARYQQGAYEAAATTFERLYAIQSNSPEICYWLGLSYYQLGRFREARKPLQRAVRLDKTNARAYNALGLVYREIKFHSFKALDAFRKAAKLDPTFADPYYNIGMTYLKISETDPAGPFYVAKAREYFNQAIAADANHPDAYFALANTYQEFSRDYQRAIALYKQQLAVNPQHEEAMLKLGKSFFQTGDYQEGIEVLSEMVARNPDNPLFNQALYQLQAGYYQKQGNYQEAARLYQEYINTLNEEEQRLYYSLEYVTSAEELAAFNALDPEAQQEYWERFWAQRDPLATTEVNERLVEHYRRVLYARDNFSKGRFPWDRRGDIYIRYGEPDDRQHFILGANEEANEVHLYPTGNARVDAIRQANIGFRYRLRAEVGTVNLSPASVISPLISSAGTGSTDSGQRVNINSAGLRCESWVFVEHGIELFFVDYGNHDVYDFPLPSAELDVRAALQQARYHPKLVAEELIKKKPESYHYDYGGDPLDFLFDVASFRDLGGKSRLEIYFNLPVSELGSQQDGKGNETWLNSAVVLQDDHWNAVVRAREKVGPITRSQTDLAGKKFGVALTTFQISVSSPPGIYNGSVEVRDLLTQKIGIYQKKIAIDDYWTPGLHLSDIKLAHDIRPSQEQGPFTRHGLRVVPNPSRLFGRSQPIFIYYEIYNLTQDDNGQTNYRTNIRINAREKRTWIGWQILSFGGKLLGRREEDQSVSMSFENRGFLIDEVQFTRVDVEQSPPGTYLLELTVVDQNDGSQVTKSIQFTVAGDEDKDRRTGGERALTGEAESLSTGNDETSPAVFLDRPEEAAENLSLGSSLGEEDTTTGSNSLPTLNWAAIVQTIAAPKDPITAWETSDSAGAEQRSMFLQANQVKQYTQRQVAVDRAYEGMIFIPAGEFIMGTRQGDADEQPAHPVYVAGFYIDKYEVTNAEYHAFIQATGYKPLRHWKNGTYPAGKGQHPVVGVTWYDAMAYASWAGKRLPTEAEWEKAARGNDGRSYPWGNTFDPTRLNVGGSGDSFEETAPVGSFPSGASPYGVQDMAGNVWEWTADWYLPYPSTPFRSSAFGEKYRVVRGGSWINYNENTQVFNRGKYFASDSSFNLGFRCVKDPPSKAPVKKAELGSASPQE